MSALATGGTLAHYRVEKRVGCGRLGEVYCAFDTRVGRQVAIKTLAPESGENPDSLEILRREARLIAQVDHPNVATLYGLEECGGQWYLILEYVQGPTLAERIAGGRLNLRESIAIAAQVAEGMAVAHAHGVVHRDLKPANIALTPAGQAKILDFGLARIVASSVDDAGRNPDTNPRGESIAGTLDYLAPEALHHGPVGRSADIYGLGVVLFEMLAGETPFAGIPMPGRIAAILEQDPPNICGIRREVPQEVGSFLDACLAKRRHQRPPSMQIVVHELARLRAVCSRRTKRNTLVVMDFEDMSPEQDQKYFCEGMSEDLVHILNRAPGIRVVSRTAAHLFQDEPPGRGSLPGVSAILEGSVRKHGPRLRLSVRLVDSESGLSIWSGQYDRETEDVLAVQEELAGSIARALEGALDPDAVPGVSPVPGREQSRSYGAYDDYLHGRSLLYQYRRRSVEQALDLFENAVRSDPGYALAWSGIANSCCFLFLYVDGRRVYLERARQASLKAIQCSPRLPEAHVARGQVLSLSGLHAEAEESFRNALHLSPNHFDAYYWYARDSFVQGRLDLAAVQFEQARHVAPDDYQCPLLVAQVYDALGRTRDARCSREDGVRIVRERLRRVPGDVRALYMGANGLVGLGQISEGLEWASTARFMEPEEPTVLYNVACVYSLAGDLEAAVETLTEAVRGGLMQKSWILNDSDLDPVRNHPRYLELLDWLDQQERSGGSGDSAATA